MKNATRRLGLAVAVVSLMGGMSGQARAGLVLTDWKVSGDAQIVRDTATGLDWLNLSQTFEISRVLNATDFQSGGDFSGFRYATVNEIHRLQTDAGIPNSNNNNIISPSLSDVNAVRQFSTLVGDTLGPRFGSSYLGPRGYTPEGGGLMLGSYVVNNMGTNPTVWNDYFSYFPSTGGNGHWLVRDSVSAVPEPSTIALVFTALPMGLGLAWKRRRKAVGA